MAVDLIEIKPEVAALGSGITLQGNALRELRSLGVWDQVQAAGYVFDTTGIRAPDPNGTVVAEIADAKTGGPDLPAAMGMPRPELARILVDRATEVGVKVRLGTTFTELSQDDDGVDVTFADGSTGRYDLVVGADGSGRGPGARSASTWRRSRSAWASGAPSGRGRPASPAPTSTTAARPTSPATAPPVRTRSTPTSSRTRRTAALSTPEEQLATMKQLSQAYHGPWDEIRETLTDPSRVNYTWFETHVLDAPWNRGRVVLIGDAAHTCPPTIAQGGAMALEDAVVLAELLTERDALDQELWDAFPARRFERAKTVVDASNQLAQWQLDHVQGDIPASCAPSPCSPASPPEASPTPRNSAMTDRLITHLRHVDLAVPDYGKQLDFYTNTWGLTAEHSDSGLAFLAAEGSPEQYVVRLREATDKRIDLISFGAATAGRRRHPGRPDRRRRRPADQRAGHPADPRRRLRLPVLRQRGPHRRDQRRRRRPGAPQDRGGRGRSRSASPTSSSTPPTPRAPAPSTRSTSRSPCRTP